MKRSTFLTFSLYEGGRKSLDLGKLFLVNNGLTKKHEGQEISQKSAKNKKNP